MVHRRVVLCAVALFLATSVAHQGVPETDFAAHFANKNNPTVNITVFTSNIEPYVSVSELCIFGEICPPNSVDIGILSYIKSEFALSKISFNFILAESQRDSVIKMQKELKPGGLCFNAPCIGLPVNEAVVVQYENTTAGTLEYKAYLSMPLELLFNAEQIESQLFFMLDSLLDLWPLFVAMIVACGLAGMIMWSIERLHDDSHFKANTKGIFQGFWWSLVTITTIGYGDKVPKTLGGRIFAALWIIAGMLCFTVITASIVTSISMYNARQAVDWVNAIIEDKALVAHCDGAAPNDLRRLSLGSTSEDYQVFYNSYARDHPEAKMLIDLIVRVGPFATSEVVGNVDDTGGENAYMISRSSLGWAVVVVLSISCVAAAPIIAAAMVLRSAWDKHAHNDWSYSVRHHSARKKYRNRAASRLKGTSAEAPRRVELNTVPLLDSEHGPDLRTRPSYASVESVGDDIPSVLVRHSRERADLLASHAEELQALEQQQARELQESVAAHTRADTST